MAAQIIGFFGPLNPNGCFSQWYACKFTVDNVVYHNAEQYMMAQKAKLFGDTVIYKLLLTTHNPKTAKQLGRKINNYNEDVWIANREEIVYNGNLAKFSQNPDLKSKLLDTKNAMLVEASPYDKIWGIGIGVSHPDFSNPKKWKGLNLLGKTLMKVRNNISK